MQYRHTWDIKMIASHMRKAGIQMPFFEPPKQYIFNVLWVTAEVYGKLILKLRCFWSSESWLSLSMSLSNSQLSTSIPVGKIQKFRTHNSRSLWESSQPKAGCECKSLVSHCEFTH